MTFLVLVRKQLSDMRWTLGLPVLAFLGLSILIAWVTRRFERILAEGEFSDEARGLGLLRAFGGPAQDFSTIAMQVCWWNHPFIILTVVGWALARGSAAVAGEIDRGTMDLTLSRPVSRATFLSAQIVASLAGFAMLAGALVVGAYVGSRLFALKSPPTVWGLLRPATIVFALGMSIFGYTLPLSAVDRVRWRPGMIALGVTLVGVIAMSLAPVFKGYEWLEKLTVFRAYAPVTIAVKGDPLAYNAGVLTCVFLVGVALSFLAFLRRDLPATGG